MDKARHTHSPDKAGNKRVKLPPEISAAMKKFPPFYQKVWLACAQIPKGQTRSYGEIAKAAGSPNAARAVGQALAKNPFWPHVPCHRVVASDGGLCGFSGEGGLKRKRKLLNDEKVLSHK